MIASFLDILSATFLQPARMRYVERKSFVFALVLYFLLFSVEASLHEEEGIGALIAFSFGALCFSLVLARVGSLRSEYRDRVLVLPAMVFLGFSGVLVMNAIQRELGVEVNVLFMLMIHFVGALFVSIFSNRPEPEFQASSYGDDVDMDALRRMRDLRLEEYGPTIGLVADYPIPGWIKLSDGKTLSFIGLFDGSGPEDVPAGCIVIAPGLIYGEGSAPQS